MKNTLFLGTKKVWKNSDGKSLNERSLMEDNLDALAQELRVDEYCLSGFKLMAKAYQILLLSHRVNETLNSLKIKLRSIIPFRLKI